MKMQVFAIYDTKAGYYKQPFMMRSTGEAIRGFTDIANDNQTEIGKHPEDFGLFHLAEFDSDKGTYENKSVPVSLGLAMEYVKPTKQMVLPIEEVK